MEVTAQIICTVCHDSLLADEERSLLATKCGHLFHQECLSKWFQRNMSVTNFRSIPTDEMLKGTCPVCSTPQWMKRCSKIFPNVDDQEANDIKSQVKKLEMQLTETKEKLSTAELLIKKQAKAIVALTSPASSSSRAVKTAGVKALAAESKVVKTRSSGSSIPKPTPCVVSPSKSSKPRTKKIVHLEQKNPSATSLRTTNIVQRFVEPTSSPSTVRRTTSSARTSGTRSAATGTPATRRAAATTAAIRRTAASQLVK